MSRDVWNTVKLDTATNGSSHYANDILDNCSLRSITQCPQGSPLPPQARVHSDQVVVRYSGQLLDPTRHPLGEKVLDHHVELKQHQVEQFVGHPVDLKLPQLAKVLGHRVEVKLCQVEEVLDHSELNQCQGEPLLRQKLLLKGQL